MDDGKGISIKLNRRESSADAKRVVPTKPKGAMTMNTIAIAEPCFHPDVAGPDIRPIADAELDAVEGGFLFVLVGAAAFSTGFFAGYGAVRFFQDVT
jgi:hypothetical protein